MSEKQEKPLVTMTQEEFNDIKATLFELNETVDRLLAEPKVYASVAKAQNRINLGAYTKGDRVMILDDNIRRKIGVFGKIVSNEIDKKGFLFVEFPDGRREKLNIGLAGEKMQCKLIGDSSGSPKDDGLNVTVLINGSMFEVHGLHGVEFTPGDQVLVNKATMQIHQKVEISSPGFIATVNSVIDNDHIDVNVNGSSRVVIKALDVPLKNGDRVMLDNSTSVAYKKLPNEDKDRFHVRAEITMTWDDIAGLDDAKQQLIEAIEMPYRRPEIYKAYNMKPPKGILLYGPPGCGKTLCAKVCAGSLAKLHGKENFESGFIYVKGPELLSKWVGDTEQGIRNLFNRGFEHYKTHGYPALLFIDEADAILPMRGSGRSSDVEKTIVPQFLSCMDGLEESGVMVMLATNQPKSLDTAAIRDGRIDNHIKISRPNAKNAIDYFRLHMKGMPVVKGSDSEELAHIAIESLFDDSKVIYEMRQDGAKDFFRLRDTVNGAMIAGLVSNAKTRAFRRDMNANKAKGVTPADMLESVNHQYHRNAEMANLVFDLEEFCQDRGFDRSRLQMAKLPLAS